MSVGLEKEVVSPNRLKATLHNLNRLTGMIRELGSRSKILRNKVRQYRCQRVADNALNTCGILENEMATILIALDLVEDLVIN